jgi:hypothetical protein
MVTLRMRVVSRGKTREVPTKAITLVAMSNEYAVASERRMPLLEWPTSMSKDIYESESGPSVQSAPRHMLSSSLEMSVGLTVAGESAMADPSFWRLAGEGRPLGPVLERSLASTASMYCVRNRSGAGTPANYCLSSISLEHCRI